MIYEKILTPIVNENNEEEIGPEETEVSEEGEETSEEGEFTEEELEEEF
jgi:hypothetical protein